MLGLAAIWSDPAADREVIGRVRAWFRALKPFSGGYYDNINIRPAELCSYRARALRQAAGGAPSAFLNARLKAASDS